MNQKYIVDSEVTVTVITNTGKTLERDNRYTESTDQILSLENLSESIQNKIHIFERRSNELNNQIRNKKKTIRFLNIVLILLMITLVSLSAGIGLKSLVSALVCSLPLSIAIGLIEKASIDKVREKRNYCRNRIKEENHRINKIKKKIKTLSKNKTLKKSNSNNFTEIKPVSEYTIDEYNIDAADKFIENYLIEKRAREMTKGKRLVKKKQKTKQNLEYKF